MNRYQLDAICKDLSKKMVFIVGPRQVGKTWISQAIMSRYSSPTYLNYDNYDDRDIINSQSWTTDTDLLIFDELHKKPDWKTFIKGIYDKKSGSQHILVTGSARLDVFRQTSDALTGRFFKHRLLPITLQELRLTQTPGDISRLISHGGFPEPFLADDIADVDRWRQAYIDGLIRQDILDFQNVGQIRTMSLLINLLTQRVGSSVSYASLARDLNTSIQTVKKYIDILEALFIVFRVSPYSRNIARSILKESKLYFFDTGLVPDRGGAAFENFMAVSLLKHCYANNDLYGMPLSLHYLRTRDGQEVDFCLVQDDEILDLIEAKVSDTNLSKTLAYFSDKYDLSGTQVVYKTTKNERDLARCRIRHADSYLQTLTL